MRKDWINRVGILLVVLVVVAGGYWLYQKRSSGILDIPGINIFKNDGSENNDGLAGEPLSEEQIIIDDVEDDLCTKFNKGSQEVTVTVEDYSDSHAKGTIAFSDEPTAAWWLAVKDKGGWRVVTSGNGDVLCREIEEDDFPVEMVPTCFDNASQRLRGR